MTDKNIVELYKKGISIMTISKRYRDYINKSNLSTRRYGSFTFTRKKINLEQSRKYVEKVLLEYKRGRFDLQLN